jgi:hypothetical protein
LLAVQRCWPYRLGASETSVYSEPEKSMHPLLKTMEAHAALTQGIAAVGSVMIAAAALRHARIQLHEGLMKPDQNLTNVRIHLEIY